MEGGGGRRPRGASREPQGRPARGLRRPPDGLQGAPPAALPCSTQHPALNSIRLQRNAQYSTASVSNAAPSTQQHPAARESLYEFQLIPTRPPARRAPRFRAERNTQYST